MATEVLAAAGAVQIVITGEGANFSSVVADANRQLDKLGLKGKEAGHQMVTSVQAASGTIRLLEGDITRNVRAVEKFITMIPGIGQALQAAFPVVGALALAGVLTRLGEEVQKFFKDMKEAPARIHDAFASSTLSMMTANDELRKNNDELDKQIAKLTGRPANGLALALDEARLAADHLQQSLDAAYEQQQKLFEAQSAGVWQQLLGVGSTKEVQGNIENFYKLIRDAQRSVNAALHSATPEDAKQYQDQLAQLQKNAIAYADAEMAKRTGTVTGPQPYIAAGGVARQLPPKQVPYAQVYGDQARNLEALGGLRDVMYQEQDRAALETLNGSKTTQLASVQNAHAANTALQKTQTELAAMLRENEQQLAEYGRTPGQIAPVPMFTAGGGRLPVPPALPLGVQDLAQSPEFREAQQGQGRSLNESLNALNESIEARQKEATAVAEHAISLQVAIGQMTRLDAAEKLAALHAQDYVEAMKRLDNEQRVVESRGDLTPLEKQAQLQAVGNQRTIVNANYGQTTAAAEETIAAATSMGALHGATDRLTQAFLDLPQHLQELLTSTVSGFNSSFASAVMAHSASGQEYRRNIENSLAGQFRSTGTKGLESALQLGEGGLMSKLGFGNAKPTGTQSDPLFVRLVAAAGAAGGTLDSSGAGRMLLGAFGALGPAGTSGASAGNFLSTVMPDITATIPFMASGGPISSNMPAIVGENGPELFVPRSSGHIVPNDALGGGSSGDVHLHIDARGATDPASVGFQIQKAMNQVRKEIAPIALAAHRRYNSSRPGSSRI